MELATLTAGHSQDGVELAQTCTSQTPEDSDDKTFRDFADLQLLPIGHIEMASIECVNTLEELFALIPDVNVLEELLKIVKEIAKIFSPIMETLEDVADAIGDAFSQAMIVLCCVSEDVVTVIQAVEKVISLTDCLLGSLVDGLTAELLQLLDLDLHLWDAITVSYQLPKIEFESFEFSQDQCMLSYDGPYITSDTFDFKLFPTFSLKIDDVLPPSQTCDLSFEDVGACQNEIACCSDSDCNLPDRPICDTNIFTGSFTCIPKKEYGESCTFNDTCKSGKCFTEAGAGLLGVCVKCGEDNHCSGVPGRPICDTNLIDGSFKCIPKKEHGDTCTFDGTCLSNNCFKPTGTGLFGTCQCNECKTSGCGGCGMGQQCYGPSAFESNCCITLGSECTVDSDCSGVPGRPICDTNISNGSLECIAKKGLGESCTFDGTCASGNCFKPSGTGLFGTCQCNECGSSGCGGCPVGHQCSNPGPFSSNTCALAIAEGHLCPLQNNDDCAGSAGCFRTSRHGNYKCCSSQNLCHPWDSGCKDWFWYCSFSGLGR